MKKEGLSVEVSYMVFAPYKSTKQKGKPGVFKKPVYAPYFFDVDIEFVKIGSKKFTIYGNEVRAELEVLDGEVLSAECFYKLDSGLSAEGLSEKQKINKKIKKEIIKITGIDQELIEEYTSYLIRNVGATPNEFVNKNKFILSRLARSLYKKIDEKEAEEILSSRATYSKNDMTIIDWEAAIVITDEGDYESDLELIKIGNYQLIRYRILDKILDARIAEIRNSLETKKNGFMKRRKKDALKKVIENQIELILHFDKIDQSLLLIGDWYSAKLYKMIVSEFYIKQWKTNVKDKLETYASIDEIVRESLAFSWERLLQGFQTAGWVILLLGYFVLFFLELKK